MAKKPDIIEPIRGTFDEVVAAIAPKVTKAAPVEVLSGDNFEVVQYSIQGESDPVDFRLDTETESIWATQAQMAELFETTQQTISYHLGNVWRDGELDENNNTKKVGIDGSKKPVTVHSLDAIISVGYRVNSTKATRFRQWATQTIKAFIEEGYVLNDRALRESPEKLNALAAKLRALRSEETQIYAKVRECFKVSASDYEPSSQEVKTFYALLQDKFHHAVTGQTGAKIILDRADHRDENMGVQTFAGKQPKASEVVVGKNYLNDDELYRLHLLSEQFLLYAEASALRGTPMTMASLHNKLDRLLEVNDYPVFDGWRNFNAETAKKHARAELALFKKRKKIEAMGIEYDEEALAAGEYDDILIEG
ncbi:RhuM family protein [Phaeobacter inhibens]|uniref:RhuM family protein n=1 Tax=Phaeobacter inhibens TaxID=221822 RepID=UPI000420CA96|nr:RhuM family protein [Phaeobacter inhibens]AUR12462.1 Virulence protein [Phaeobacter inhibens]